MSIFESLSKEPEFVKLNAKRASALDLLVNHKESLEELDEVNPSLRAFQRLEVKIDTVIGNYETASCAVAAWFTKNDGDTLTDAGYKAYRVKAVKVLNEVEILRDKYHDIFKIDWFHFEKRALKMHVTIWVLYIFQRFFG